MVRLYWVGLNYLFFYFKFILMKILLLFVMVLGFFLFMSIFGGLGVLLDVMLGGNVVNEDNLVLIIFINDLNKDIFNIE